jgi:hypothetical protein
MSALRKKAVRQEVDLVAMIASGPAGGYEALQLYRSKAIRLRAKDDVIGAIKTTATGSKNLLIHTYETAGSELASLFLELVNEHKMELNEELRALVYEIDDAYPKTSSARVEFLKGVVKWTIMCGNRELGDSELQTRLGECLWEKQDKTAAFHFAAGEAPSAFCEKIFSTYQNSNEHEKRDQALTSGVVNFLALENMRDANDLFSQYKKAANAKKFTTNSKLFHFCDYLLQTCRRDAAPLFKQLVNAYASELDYDGTVPTLLMGPIAQRLFGIKPKINPMMSMLQSMIS